MTTGAIIGLTVQRGCRHGGINTLVEDDRTEVPELPAMGAHVEEISFFWDGFMDNIFSDMAARGKINRSRDSVANALSSATNAVQWVRKEINAIKEDWDTINIQIAETKKELLEERKRMISEALKPGK